MSLLCLNFYINKTFHHFLFGWKMNDDLCYTYNLKNKKEEIFSAKKKEMIEYFKIYQFSLLWFPPYWFIFIFGLLQQRRKQLPRKRESMVAPKYRDLLISCHTAALSNSSPSAQLIYYIKNQQTKSVGQKFTSEISFILPFDYATTTVSNKLIPKST